MNIRFENADKRDKPSLEAVVKEKIQILRDFKVVNMRTVGEVRQKLFDAARANPHRNYEIVLEQLTQKMIMDSMRDD